MIAEQQTDSDLTTPDKDRPVTLIFLPLKLAEYRFTIQDLVDDFDNQSPVLNHREWLDALQYRQVITDGYASYSWAICAVGLTLLSFSSITADTESKSFNLLEAAAVFALHLMHLMSITLTASSTARVSLDREYLPYKFNSKEVRQYFLSNSQRQKHATHRKKHRKDNPKRNSGRKNGPASVLKHEGMPSSDRVGFLAKNRKPLYLIVAFSVICAQEYGLNQRLLLNLLFENLDVVALFFFSAPLTWYIDCKVNKEPLKQKQDSIHRNDDLEDWLFSSQFSDASVRSLTDKIDIQSYYPLISAARLLATRYFIGDVFRNIINGHIPSESPTGVFLSLYLSSIYYVTAVSVYKHTLYSKLDLLLESDSVRHAGLFCFMLSSMNSILSRFFLDSWSSWAASPSFILDFLFAWGYIYIYSVNIGVILNMRKASLTIVEAENKVTDDVKEEVEVEGSNIKEVEAKVKEIPRVCSATRGCSAQIKTAQDQQESFKSDFIKSYNAIVRKINIISLYLNISEPLSLISESSDFISDGFTNRFLSIIKKMNLMNKNSDSCFLSELLSITQCLSKGLSEPPDMSSCHNLGAISGHLKQVEEKLKKLQMIIARHDQINKLVHQQSEKNRTKNLNKDDQRAQIIEDCKEWKKSKESKEIEDKDRLEREAFLTEIQGKHFSSATFPYHYFNAEKTSVPMLYFYEKLVPTLVVYAQLLGFQVYISGYAANYPDNPHKRDLDLKIFGANAAHSSYLELFIGLLRHFILRGNKGVYEVSASTGSTGAGIYCLKPDNLDLSNFVDLVYSGSLSPTFDSGFPKIDITVYSSSPTSVSPLNLTTALLRLVIDSSESCCNFSAQVNYILEQYRLRQENEKKFDHRLEELEKSVAASLKNITQGGNLNELAKASSHCKSALKLEKENTMKQYYDTVSGKIELLLDSISFKFSLNFSHRILTDSVSKGLLKQIKTMELSLSPQRQNYQPARINDLLYLLKNLTRNFEDLGFKDPESYLAQQNISLIAGIFITHFNSDGSLWAGYAKSQTDSKSSEGCLETKYTLPSLCLHMKQYLHCYFPVALLLLAQLHTQHQAKAPEEKTRLGSFLEAMPRAMDPQAELFIPKPLTSSHHLYSQTVLIV